MRCRGLVLGIFLALGLGLALGAVVSKQSSKTAPPKEKKEKTIKIVVLTKKLNRGVKLTKKDIKIREWPERLVGSDFIKTLKEAEGRVIITNVVSGEPLLQGKLAEIGSLEGLSTLIEPGRRAFSIRVKDDTGVAGFLLPGSRVDVHATLETEERKARGARDQDGPPRSRPKKVMITQTILQDIEVLAAGGEKEAGRKKSRINASVVTLSLTPGESDRLAFAASTGTIWLSLRNPRDRGKTTPKIVSYDDLLNRKEEPVPEEPEEKAAPDATEEEQKAPAYIVEVIHGGKISRVEF